MSKFSRDKDFTVGEEKILLYILSFLFFGVFIICLVDMLMNGFESANLVSYVFVLSLAPAVLFFRKAGSKHIYIRINTKGIYQDEKLVTDWPHFLKAYLTQKSNSKFFIDVRDNFMLVVEYTKDNPRGGFRKMIPLTNTQNKSEEDVIAAVKFFWNEYQKQRTSY